MSAGWALLDPASPGWAATVDALWARLDPAGGLVVPAYFVKATFARMGGLLATDGAGAVGLLFPRRSGDGRRAYTLRMRGGDPAAVAALVAPHPVVAYDPVGTLTYAATHAERGGFDLGAPGREDLGAIGALHSAIWGGGVEARYPADLWSAELGPATALVARREGRLAGFLLGFHRSGLPALAGLGLPYRLDLAVESQVLGVASEARRSGLAATLKLEQARLALAQGLDLIHWTADPLQYPNAALNFGRLRAVAGEHYAAYYPFHNALNRVPASRLGLVWLPRSARARAALAGTPGPAERGLGRFPGCARLNRRVEALGEPGGAPFLALHIPADWTALQRDDLGLAARWRAAADSLLARHLGFAPGRYLAVDAASEGAERFLVLQRYEPGLLLP
ncbi:MAG TPA: GNAT family N-acetyltransferase [Chloroflexaceae bacterium]|nr:GNAT family N-acetyltransferase [Chloroflexaceae bacterium]